MASEKRGRRIVEGRVLKAHNDKTRVVGVQMSMPHNLYGRIIRRRVKYVAHDETNQSQVGDLVRIEECRPMSRTKRWRLREVVGRDIVALADIEEPEAANHEAAEL